MAAEASYLTLPGGSVVGVDGFPFIALIFTPNVGVGAIQGQVLFPTQIWESMGGFLLFGFLSWLWHQYRRFDGQILAAMLCCYGLLRMTTEQFRGDTVRGIHEFGSVTLATSEIWAIIFFATAGVLCILRLPAGLGAETPRATASNDDLLEADDLGEV